MIIYETSISGIKNGKTVKETIISEKIMSIDDVKTEKKDINFLEINSVKKHYATVVLTNSSKVSFFWAKITSNKKINTLMIEEENMSRAMKRIISLFPESERINIFKMKNTSFFNEKKYR